MSLRNRWRDEYFYSADGELLVVPQQGRLRFCTELGVIDVEPKEIALLPRGLVYRVEVLEGPARGFVCENYGQKFDLPGRGPIGANCMANRRDFKTPVAAFEDRETQSRVVVKWCGQFHETTIGHSPLDVVAWHGNYAPCKYDLETYCPSARCCSIIGSVDLHGPDRSLRYRGNGEIDFVLSATAGWWPRTPSPTLVPQERDVGADGQHPRHLRREAEGLRSRRHVAAQLHAPARPDRNASKPPRSGSEADEARGDDELHVRDPLPTALTPFAAGAGHLQEDYIDCWGSLEKKFDGTPGIK